MASREQFSRDQFPKARLSDSHYFFTLARGESMRCFALRPWAAYTLAGLFPVCGILYFAASMVYIMRDDVVAAVFQRQQAMQQAYEDRITDLRAQLDRVSSRQLLDQNSLEGKMHELISRQAQLESRAAVVAALAKAVDGKTAKAETAPLPVPRPASLGTRRDQRALLAPSADKTDGQDLLPAGASSYAATGKALPPALGALGMVIKDRTGASRPRPYAVEVVPAQGHPRARPLQAGQLLDPYTRELAGNPNLPVELRLGALTQSLDRIEFAQLRKVETVGARARSKAARLREAIQKTGLSPDRLKLSGAAKESLGGPFVPYKYDPDAPAFERAVYGLQKNVLEAARLRSLVAQLPVRRPLPANAEITSSFGRRVDPFNGRLAVHTGIDFRQYHGAPVYATASGVVVKAGRNGGYGNMVEIDHGNGITSRYAHLASITVSQGQRVGLGKRIGALGSTGRSTGPHLHYEVRLNDNAVNPMRFLRAGSAL